MLVGRNQWFRQLSKLRTHYSIKNLYFGTSHSNWLIHALLKIGVINEVVHEGTLNRKIKNKVKWFRKGISYLLRISRILHYVIYVEKWSVNILVVYMKKITNVVLVLYVKVPPSFRCTDDDLLAHDLTSVTTFAFWFPFEILLNIRLNRSGSICNPYQLTGRTYSLV